MATNSNHNWHKEIGITSAIKLETVKANQLLWQVTQVYDELCNQASVRLASSKGSLDYKIKKSKQFPLESFKLAGALLQLANGLVAGHYRKQELDAASLEAKDIATFWLGQELVSTVITAVQPMLKDLPEPDEQTCRSLKITPTGEVYVAWDPEGTLRKIRKFSTEEQQQLELLQQSDVSSKIEPELALFYLEIWHIILTAALDAPRYDQRAKWVIKLSRQKGQLTADQIDFVTKLYNYGLAIKEAATKDIDYDLSFDLSLALTLRVIFQIETAGRNFAARLYLKNHPTEKSALPWDRSWTELLQEYLHFDEKASLLSDHPSQFDQLTLKGFNIVCAEFEKRLQAYHLSLKVMLEYDSDEFVAYSLVNYASDLFEWCYKPSLLEPSLSHYYQLTEYLPAKIFVPVQEAAQERVKAIDLPVPDFETCNLLQITPDGSPWLEWDPLGEIRQKQHFSEREIELCSTAYYAAKVNQQLSQSATARTQTLLLFLQLFEQITTVYAQQKKKFGKKLSGALDDLQGQGRWLGSFTYLFLKDLFRTADNGIRVCLPQSQITRSLKMEEKGFVGMPKPLKSDLHETCASYGQSLSLMTKKQIFQELPQTPQVEIVQLKFTTEPAEQIKVFQRAAKQEKYRTFLMDVWAKANKLPTELRLLAVCELKRLGKLTADKLKQAKNLVYPANQARFEDYLTKEVSKHATSLAELEFLTNLTKPIRQEIHLNQQKITHSAQALDQTVQLLNDYVGPIDEEKVPEAEEKTSKPSTPTKSEESESSSSSLDLLKELLEKKQIPVAEIAALALKQGELPDTYIAQINQEFFEELGDQLVVMDDEKVWIDEYYVDFAREKVGE